MGRNPFFNPFDLAFKNIANTCVLHWNDKLYALWEVGHQSRFPPQTCIRGRRDGSYLPLWKPVSH